MSSAQKIRASTQKFTEIYDIREDIVLVSHGNTCLVIQVQSTNFALLSKEEQHAKIVSYASMLNSLSFPIQIVIRSKRMDISSYLKLLELEGSKNDKQANYIKQYRTFVEELIKVNTVLDKTFYLVVSFSALEIGVSGVTLQKEELFQSAKTALHTKAESLATELGRIGLQSKILQTDQLIKLFYDIYNQENGISGNISNTVSAPVVRTT